MQIEECPVALNKDVLAIAAKINKAVGGEVVVLGSSLKEPTRFPTGSLGLDISLGGGWPGNQWVEVYGPE